MSMLVYVKSALHALTSVIYDGSHLLPWVPVPVKAACLALLILQFPTFPLSWHLGVFRQWIRTTWLIRFIGHKRYLDEWHPAMIKGGGVRHYRHRITKRATPGQCDFNMHLSNSSYALNADRARIEWMLFTLGPYLTFGSGAGVALGASHFVYMKEIPIMSKYTMETRISGYGDKWLYGVVEYIMLPKSGKSTSGKARDKLVEQVREKLDSESLKTSITSADNSGTSTPLEKVKATATLRASQPREDGGVVACIAIFEACFKIGRITIPPRVVLHYAHQSPSLEARQHAREICLSKDKGRKWLQGGWRNEPNADLLGREIGLGGAEDNDVWFKSADQGMVLVNEGLARSV